MNSDHPSIPGGDLKLEKLPAHVAIVMDGNGRWAKKRLLNRIQGHEKGAEAVRSVTEACLQIGIPYLTLYAFSTENWQRPQTEVGALMGLLRRFLDTRESELVSKGIRLLTIGQVHRLPSDVQAALDRVKKSTGHNRALSLTLALSYGGRDEIVEACRCIGRRIESGALGVEDIDETTVTDCLFTRGTPDPDILIRTSGEKRLSNFLLWQVAYAELYFTETLWPDFGREEFTEILRDYQHRDRRFGKVHP